MNKLENVINVTETPNTALAALKMINFVGIIFYDGVNYVHSSIVRDEEGDVTDCFGYCIQNFINGGWYDEEEDECYNEFVIFDKELKNIIVSDADALEHVNIRRTDDLNFIQFCKRTVETSSNWDTILGCGTPWFVMEAYYAFTHNYFNYITLSRIVNTALRGADKIRIKEVAETISEEMEISLKFALVIIGHEASCNLYSNFFDLYNMSQEELIQQLVEWLNN
jgi:hypothetical protein